MNPLDTDDRNFSVHDVLAAAEQIIKAEPFVLHRGSLPPKPDASGLVIVGLFLALVAGSIVLVNWYFQSTFGV